MDRRGAASGKDEWSRRYSRNLRVRKYFFCVERGGPAPVLETYLLDPEAHTKK